MVRRREPRAREAAATLAGGRRIERVRPLLMLTDALIPNPLRVEGHFAAGRWRKARGADKRALPAFSSYVGSDDSDIERGKYTWPLTRRGFRRQHRPGLGKV